MVWPLFRRHACGLFQKDSEVMRLEERLGVNGVRSAGYSFARHAMRIDEDSSVADDRAVGSIRLIS